MRLEQTIRSTMTEAMDMDGRLDQLVRAGLMPTSSLPLLKRAISRMHAGMSLQGAERDVMNMFISSMMFIVLGDDTVFNKARAGAKGYATEETEDDGWYTHSQIHGSMKSEKHPKGISAAEWKSGIRWHHGKNKRINIKEEVELDENAPIVAHLTKRYGDNIRKSHVMSAAKDFGVDASKLSKAVRKKLGKTMLPEAKEKTEYDYEGDMAMGQLKSIIANSQRMHDMLSDDTNLPEWVQSKITLAEDYISTASNYMQGEMNEEKMPFEGPYRKVGERKDKYGNPVKNVAKHLAKKAMNAQKNEEVEQVDEISSDMAHRYLKGKRERDYNTSADGTTHTLKKPTTLNRLNRDIKGTVRALRTIEKSKKTNEEVEQVDEISKATMGRYINKAKDSIDMTSYRSGIKDGTAISSSTPYKSNNPLEKKLSKRHKGIETAVKKLTKEESEQIDELSKATMGRYINKAATKMGSQGVTAGLKIAADEKSSKNFKDMGKREKGISRAVNKLTKEDIDAVKKMNESYKTAFETALNEYGIKSPSELDESKRKEFFNHVDLEFKKGDN